MANRTTSAWQRIRLLRAGLPDAVPADRATMIRSALEQAEQLMRAAAEVGPAARPLPLFYALSQAGRAIAAARLGDDWQLSGHGLTAPDQREQKDVLRRVVAPRKSRSEPSSFRGVASAVRSARLTAPVELGAVWAAMPDLIDPMPQMPDLDPEWRRPLRAYWAADDPRNPPPALPRPVELLLGGFPIDPHPNAPLDGDELLRELEAHYPTSSGVAIPHWIKHPELLRQWAPTRESLPTFCWPEFPEHRVTDEQLDRIAPDYRRRGVRVLIPKLPTGDFLSPLMLWWVLLFGLSSVARYDPELWVAALDVNDSRQAVPIEAMLDEALDALPELILEALTVY